MLSVDGASVKLTNEKILTGVTPYAVDVSKVSTRAMIARVEIAPTNARINTSIT